MTRFLLDTSIVSAAMWKTPDPGVLAKLEEHGEWLAEERVRLDKIGKHTAVVDGQIAAVAATNGIPVVTANVADFSVFKGLAVHNWMSAGR